MAIDEHSEAEIETLIPDATSDVCESVDAVLFSASLGSVGVGSANDVDSIELTPPSLSQPPPCLSPRPAADFAALPNQNPAAAQKMQMRMQAVEMPTPAAISKILSADTIPTVVRDEQGSESAPDSRGLAVPPQTVETPVEAVGRAGTTLGEGQSPEKRVRKLNPCVMCERRKGLPQSKSDRLPRAVFIFCVTLHS